MNYKNKNVVVTGASGGMGKVLCKRLAEQGAYLSICSNDSEALLAMTEELSKVTKVFSKTVDITNEKEVAEFYEEAYSENGDFYAVANLAGLSIPGAIAETEEVSYDKMVDVNLKGTFFSCKHFVKHAADSAIVVNVGSMAALNANPNAPLYCTSKAAVNMFSKALLLQFGKQNIRVTTVNPGGADTTFWGTRAVDKTKLMLAEEVVDILMFVICSNPSVQIHEISFESMTKFN